VPALASRDYVLIVTHVCDALLRPLYDVLCELELNEEEYDADRSPALIPCAAPMLSKWRRVCSEQTVAFCPC
jgi:hypothetical protein